MSSIFKKHNKTKSSRKSKSSRRSKSYKSSRRSKSPKLILLIKNKLYPFWYNKISFPEAPNSHLQYDKTWDEHIVLAFKMYGNKSSLPKGSILFHGSTVVDPVNTIKPIDKSYFFFGLDAFISIWYISELVYTKFKYERTSTPSYSNGYLNVYQTLQAIPYKYLERPHGAIYHPDYNKECENMACMHPQFGYHQSEYDTFTPVELSIEFTIPTNQITNKLKLVGVYGVDVSKLFENTNKNFDQFKAVDAIILETDLTK
jgi:hypothetical protein